MIYAGIDYHKYYSLSASWMRKANSSSNAASIIRNQGCSGSCWRLARARGRRLRIDVQLVLALRDSGADPKRLLHHPGQSLQGPVDRRGPDQDDKISSRTLAMLLRVGVVPACHIPDRKTRDRKEVLRQRAIGQTRTAVRCRIHSLIGKQHDLAMPQVSDLFGRKGKTPLEKAVLPTPDGMLLKQNLDMLDELDKVIKADEKSIREKVRQIEPWRFCRVCPGWD